MKRKRREKRKKLQQEQEDHERQEEKEEEMEDIQIVEGEEVIATTGLPKGLSHVLSEQFYQFVSMHHHQQQQQQQQETESELVTIKFTEDFTPTYTILAPPSQQTHHITTGAPTAALGAPSEIPQASQATSFIHPFQQQQ